MMDSRHTEIFTQLQAQIKDYYARKVPFRVYHGSTNATRILTFKRSEMVDISGLNRVLSVDTDMNVAIVEPNVPMDKMVDATLRYGLQTAGGSRLYTSLLILKIGSKILVEGSHNYKIHVFRASSPTAPVLYQARYDCEMIRLAAGAEAKSHNGDWQGWVLERI